MDVIFHAPMVLGALAVLPLLWLLFRALPPRPRPQLMSSLLLLRRVQVQRSVQYRTPWWLTVLRLAMVAASIVALAQPHVQRPDAAVPVAPEGLPVVLVVQNGWASAAMWSSVQAAAVATVTEARREGRGVVLWAAASEKAPTLLDPSAALARVRAMRPQPWPAAPLAASRFAEAPERVARTVVLSDGLAREGQQEALRWLQRRGPVVVVQPPADGRHGVVAGAPRIRADGWALTVQRPAFSSAPALPLAVIVRGGDGALLSRQAHVLPAGEGEAVLNLALPPAVRRSAAVLQVTPQVPGVDTSAAATAFLPRGRHAVRVGIASMEDGTGVPLLSPVHYIARALEPVAEPTVAPLGDLLAAQVDAVILPDGPVPAAMRASLEAMVRQGGVLIRFAGPLLDGARAQAGRAADEDALLPVPLARGTRSVGGALSMTAPLGLGEAAPDSPLAGVPLTGDVRVHTQILARPGLDLDQRVWATLEDGTPLVSGKGLGQGWLALVHTSANTEWSDLVLSSVFGDLLERLVGLGSGREGTPGRYAAHDVLDAWGGRVAAPTAVRARHVALPDDLGLSVQDVPAGLYRSTEASGAVWTVNLGPRLEPPMPMRNLPTGVIVKGLDDAVTSVPLAPVFMALALMLWVAETLASLWLAGRLRLRPWATTALLAALMTAPPARANDDVLEALALPRLAHVQTGVSTVDAVAQAGLESLTDYVMLVSSAELGEPMTVNPNVHDLVLFPFLYWPVVAQPLPLSDGGRERVQRYLATGGVILFDTRDSMAVTADGASTPERQALAKLLQGLAVPPLTPMPEDHVLTRSFFLLSAAPGRTTGDTVWVAEPLRTNDGVSALVVGSHDWAGAWARDERGRPLFAAVPGGMAQRDLAYRFGLNAVMVALTGNYKEDQVHLPAILERLTQ